MLQQREQHVGRSGLGPYTGRGKKLLRRLCASLLLMLVLVLSSPLPARAAEDAPIAFENEIKAVYVYNFIRFTEWPENESAGGRQALSIAIVGNLPLLKIFKGEEFRTASNDVDLSAQACDDVVCVKHNRALFIDSSRKNEMPRMLYSLAGSPILTVSDIPGFAEHGGMIELRKKEGRVVFRINLQAVKNAGLYISAQLLQLAEIVGEKP